MERKNRIWITIFGKMAGIVTAIFVIASVILCIVAWCEEIYITDSPFLDGLIFLVGGFFVAFGHFVCSMLIVQFLDNVQTIREKLDSISSPEKLESTPPPALRDNTPTVKNSGTSTINQADDSIDEEPAGSTTACWTCTKGRFKNPTSTRFCKECGTYK